ncbi:TrlF family AAA-like ATPase [Aurantivibrio plasticivorans]
MQTILDDGYVELKNYADELKTSHSEEWASFIGKVGSEENALKYDSKAYFYTDSTDDEGIRAKNYAETLVAFLEAFQKEEVCIAVTDHNYAHSCLLDALLGASKNSIVSVIGGVEINVQGVHILALFDQPIYGKSSFSEGIKTFLSKIEIDSKLTNEALTVSNKSYTEVLSKIQENHGITIYPHCNSDNGLFQERGRTDRTHLGDQFNYQEFNILQGKNKSGGERLLSYIASKSSDLTAGYCYTTATDARCLRDILSPDDSGNHTWIKADPTFEGLKQIMFETSRISIQGNRPEDKSGYQVIDRIEISNDLILNDHLDLNSNMNSIIGGRSTGKSVLLTAIAQKLKTEEPISFAHKPEYEAFVQGVSSSLSVIWKDGEINDDRDIEFFQQGYMYDLATDSKKLSELIQDILRIKGKSNFLESYFTKKAEIKKFISSSINDFFQVVSDISRRSASLSEKGDSKGVRDEIRKLEDRLKELDSLSLTESERENYERYKGVIEGSRKLIEKNQKDISQLKRLKEISIIRQDIDYEFSSLSDETRKNVRQVYEGLKSEVNGKWISELDDALAQINKQDSEESAKIAEAESNADYIKADLAYKNSTQLKEVQDRIIEQKKILNGIEVIASEIQELEKQKKQLSEKIINGHSEYFSVTEGLLPNLSDSQDGLDIEANYEFDVERYRNILKGALNQQSNAIREITEFNYSDHEQYISEVSSLFDSLMSGSLNMKGGYTSQSLATAILTECFYEVSYDLVYEEDNFNHMSDGKKAFVVLKLLLDFSDKKCPILIDQPEDDLDNRAIYRDLVQYLKRKKVQRQIIVATHNPNIVVGSDSELVVVANQHGVKSENQSSRKFAYKTGSLENSKPLDEANKIVLDAQGIREHVCVILEGGDAAFRLREKKYALSS